MSSRPASPRGPNLALRVIRSWIPIAVVATVLVAMVGAAVQQNYRQSANDPQIQMAEDAAAAIDAGRLPSDVAPSPKVDISRSLAPFIITFDDAGHPLAASVMLDEQVPASPGGVFDYVRQNGEDRFTWQPKPGVRSAAVVTRFNRTVNGTSGGFVLVGRSLREVENREDDLRTIVVLSWAIAMGGSFLAVAVMDFVAARWPSGS
jgi:hypothetical protein